MSSRWTMSSYNLNTILSSYVSEHAYLPFSLPVSGWVCNKGLKGSLERLLSVSVYEVLRFGCVFAIFFAFLRYAGAYSILYLIKNSLYRIFYRVKADRSLFLSFQNTINKGFALPLFFKNIPDKIPHFNQGWFCKLWQHILNCFYFISSAVHE